MCNPDSDVEFVNDIAPDVLGVLEKERFFERLDELFCPADPSIQSVKCGHSFGHSVSILRNLGMDSDDVGDVLAVLRSRGVCCDCEVLYNLAEESRLKAQYSKARASELSRGEKQSQPSEN
jgi:hypothetical protein